MPCSLGGNRFLVSSAYSRMISPEDAKAKVNEGLDNGVELIKRAMESGGRNGGTYQLIALA
jgi:hypothetical protein